MENIDNKEKLQSIGSELSADELLEEGLGLIARGLYRLAHTNEGPFRSLDKNSKKEAVNAGQLVANIILELVEAWDEK